MITSLFELDINSTGVYVGCEDKKLEKDLYSYGFIFGIKVRLVSKSRHGVVVEVLDGCYSINKNTAKIIKVKRSR